MANLNESDRVRLRNVEIAQRELKELLASNTIAVRTLADNTQQLVEAWAAARWFIHFVQIAAKVALAVGSLWIIFKGIPDWLGTWRGR